MKNFFIWVLVFIMFMLGWVGIATFHTAETPWIAITGLLFSGFISFPAISWWEDYFNKLFKNGKK